MDTLMKEKQKLFEKKMLCKNAIDKQNTVTKPNGRISPTKNN